MAWHLAIHHIDVGQGESTLVIAHNDALPPNDPNYQRSALIDGGLPTAARQVHDYVDLHLHRGLSRIIVSHDDNDHSGGITELLMADNRTTLARRLAHTGYNAALAALDIPPHPDECCCVAAAVAAMAAVAMGAYGAHLHYATEAGENAANACLDEQIINVRLAAELGYRTAEERLQFVQLNPSLLPTDELYDVLPRTVAYGALRIGSQIIIPGVNAAAVLRQAYQTIQHYLCIYTGQVNNSFDTGPGDDPMSIASKYSRANVIDRGNVWNIQPKDEFVYAVDGAVVDHESEIRTRMPNARRMRTTPPLGSEVLWNSGQNPIPAPDGAPTIWMVAQNRFVRKANQDNIPVNNSSLNSLSLAFIIRFNNFFYYTGGDLEHDSEILIANDILSNPLRNPQGGYFPVPGHICAFKCGHHGSSESTWPEFIQAICARAAFISTGYNTYGHPTQNVISSLHGDADIQRFYLTNCITQRHWVPASGGLTQWWAPGNKSTVGGDNRQPPNHQNDGSLVLRITEAQSLSGYHPLDVLHPGDVYHGFRVTYWEKDRPGGAGFVTRDHDH